MDIFQDVREAERLARQQHESKVKNLKDAMRLGDAIVQLEHNSTFQQFQRILGDMLEHRTKELLLAVNEVEVFKLQGRCLELRAILALVSDARNNLMALANLLEQEEDQFVEVSRNFKPSNSSKEQA